MALEKKDAPANATGADKPETKTLSKEEGKDAINEVIDTGAGAPPAQREAAERLPEANEMDAKIKEAYLADDAGTEAKAKAEVVELSRDSHETPSGRALEEVAGIEDDIERGEEYTRIKNAVRLGTVPASDEDLKAKKAKK